MRTHSSEIAIVFKKLELRTPILEVGGVNFLFYFKHSFIL